MTQARDVADGKFTNNVLTVSSADNIVGSFESTDAVQWIAMQDSDTSSSTHVMLGAIGDDLRFRAGNNEVGRWLSGGGLAFNGDTAQANALDDYEEGTFTPALNLQSGNFSITYTAQTGHYTRIGNRVWCDMNINFSSHNGGTGVNVGYRIEGFPFTSNSTAVGAFPPVFDNNTADPVGFGRIENGSTTAIIFQTGPDHGIASSSNLFISVCYRV